MRSPPPDHHRAATQVPRNSGHPPPRLSVTFGSVVPQGPTRRTRSAKPLSLLLPPPNSSRRRARGARRSGSRPRSRPRPVAAARRPRPRPCDHVHQLAAYVVEQLQVQRPLRPEVLVEHGLVTPAAVATSSIDVPWKPPAENVVKADTALFAALRWRCPILSDVIVGMSGRAAVATPAPRASSARTGVRRGWPPWSTKSS